MALIGTFALEIIIPVLLVRLPCLLCFTFNEVPQSPIIVVLGHNTTNVNMEWKFDTQGATIANIEVKRFLKNKDNSVSNEISVAYFAPGPIKAWNVTMYTFSGSLAASGYANFTIKDVLKRLDNTDGTKVSFLSGEVYTYRLDVKTIQPLKTFTSSTVDLQVYFPSSCEIHPTATTVNETEKVSLSVITTGNPPVHEYIWTYPNGSRLTGNNTLTFTASRQDAGTYKLSVYNGIGDRSYCASNITVHFRPRLVNISVFKDSQSKVREENGIIYANETDSFSITCESHANPEATYSWKVPNPSLFTELNQQTLVMNKVTRNHAGKYVCTASNVVDETRSSKNLTVYFIDLPEFPGFKSAVISKDNPHFTLNITVNSHPAVNISRTRCQYSNLKGALVQKVVTNGFVSIFSVNMTGNDSQSCNCTFENEAGRVSAHIPIYKGDSWRWREGHFRILNQDLLSLSLQEIYELNNTVKEMLENVYRFVSYVNMVTVERFRKGSIIVDFKLHGIAGLDDADYLAPLKDAVAKSPSINGLNIGSIVPGGYVPPSTTSTPTTTVQTTTVENTTTPSELGDLTIIIIVIVVVVVLVVLFIVFIVCYCKKKRSNKDDPDLVDQGGAVAIPMDNEPRGRNSEGYSPSRYAERGPVEPAYDSVERRPKDANDNPTQPEGEHEKPAYAAVDKSKKTKKKKTGEVFYADLGDLKMNDDQAAGRCGGKDAKMAGRNQETVYAQIVGTKKPVGDNQNTGRNDITVITRS